MIISLDPSSTALGAALFSDAGKFVEMLVMRPDYRGACCLLKLNQLGDELDSYLAEVEAAHGKVRFAIVEEPPRYQGMKSNPTAQHQAYGVVGRVLHCRGVTRVYTVHPNTWAGGKSKEQRQWVARQKMGLNPSQDRGGDAMDARQMGLWWITRNPDKLVTDSAKRPETALAGTI